MQDRHRGPKFNAILVGGDVLNTTYDRPRIREQNATGEGKIHQAHPDAPRCADNVTFFTRLDYCHVTVERRWRLRQLIKPYQDIGGEAYLLAPAWLKTMIEEKIIIFTSEIQAKEYLMEQKL
ncbi:hypothetical protein NDU88_003807 [Pleurodeles waltl]|uniref:Uncharacterized protein n=1 Tax=Pleurodeles waltl TaxID=8319 RepID=A0AAV7LML9_PLEWA|nr:hypothetical protein NDU88_003807 [Pleurodeles waltl]